MRLKATTASLVIMLSLSLLFQAVPAHAFKLVLTSSEPVVLTWQQKAAIRKACINLDLGDYTFCKTVSQKVVAVKPLAESDVFLTVKETKTKRFMSTLAVVIVDPDVENLTFTTLAGDGKFVGQQDHIVEKSWGTVFFKNGLKSSKSLTTIRIDIDFKPAPVILGTISGTVRDATDNFSIKGALAAAMMQDNPSITGNVSSDESGNYVITDLLPGTYDLHVAATSYVSELVSGLVVSPGLDTSQDLNLTMLPCPERPVKDYRGVSLIDDLLGRRETGGNTTTPEYISESIRYIRQNGFNVIRVPFYWESYIYNSTEFLDRIEFIAQEAEANNLCVFFDNHHFYTTSYWELIVPDKPPGRGFPSFVLQDFPPIDNDYIATAGPFWEAFLSNSYSVNGTSIWDVQADFLSLVINRVDEYDSVVGYEIINEPHLFDKEQYSKLGDYHTYMAQKIRTITDKKIFFDRENTRGISREPSLEPLIFPAGVSNIVYAPHLYAIPYPDSSAEWQINNFRIWADQWGSEVVIGETVADTQQDAEQLLSVTKQNGIGWSVWSWKEIDSSGRGRTYYESDSMEATNVLRVLMAAIDNVY